MKKLLLAVMSMVQLMAPAFAQNERSLPAKNTQVKTANGIVEGNLEQTGILSFKGVPYAAPPVGNLRWREPQPVQNWEGVRAATNFGPRAMQPFIFTDMNFRSNGMSEDCLYLNVWTPNVKGKLPVLVYFYGGGFIAGDGSEYRYDGESMAKKGIVALTVNYRLGVFGLMAHPELTRESPHHASGNYGLLDQAAALAWVHQNIAAFGGDPEKVTIAGESAGSFSVSAQMASPLSRGLIAGAIGESGSILGLFSPVALSKAEEIGTQFAQSTGTSSLAALRALPADSILKMATKQYAFRFPFTVDGYFFPKDPLAIYQAGEEAHVPLLVGWNSQESDYRSILGGDPVNKESFEKAVQKLYGDKKTEILKVYAVHSNADVEQAATDLGSDRFIAFSTWRWADLQEKTGTRPVFRYYYERPRPATTSQTGNSSPAKGAVHSAEIEYAMGNLSTNKVFAWAADDYKVSAILQEYFANFIKTGNPNGKELPKWPATSSGNPVPVMHIGVNSHVAPAAHDDRYQVLQQLAQ